MLSSFLHIPSFSKLGFFTVTFLQFCKFKMLTKKQLFQEILDLGISWNKDPTGFRLSAKNILLSEYENVSEETLDRYLRSFCAKISKISKEHKNSPVKKMLDSKRHTAFYDTVIEFSFAQVQVNLFQKHLFLH